VSEKSGLFHSFWFSVVMGIVSLGMLAEYTRLVLTTDDSTRRIIVLCIWLVIAICWIVMFFKRLKTRKAK
jgi:tellurite resistance protein TehA-like permease